MALSRPPFTSPVFILVRPQMGENIGAAARAMLNFGLKNLRIVAPRDGWPNQAAIDMAAGAFDEMPEPAIYTTLSEAAADLHWTYGTTARPRDMAKTVRAPRDAAAHAASLQPHRTGFVFGAERTGLTNEEVVLCHDLVTIPVDSSFPSLNLAQAVGLCAYEWRLTQVLLETKPTSAPHELAAQGEIIGLAQRLEEALETKSFFRTPEIKPTMMRNIQNALLRGQFSAQEIRTFHGMISALAGGRGKGRKRKQ